VKTSPQQKAAGGRGSPDVVEKRRAARAFNEALLGGVGAALVDGRTERRRRRLLEELSQGTIRGGKRELKPIEVLSRVQELLDLGEPLAAIRKACPKPRPIEATPEIIERIRQIHEAYTFPAAAYTFVGLDTAALKKAGVIAEPRNFPRNVPAARATSGPRSTRPPAKGRPARVGRRGAA